MIARLLCLVLGRRVAPPPDDSATTVSTCKYCGGPNYSMTVFRNAAGQPCGSAVGCPDCHLSGTLDAEANAAREQAARDLAPLIEEFGRIRERYGR